MATTRDLYVQFKSIEGVYGANATTLQEDTVDTGLSIRGGLVWCIHFIEWWTHMGFTSPNLQTYDLVLSTVPGQAALPALGDRGTIGYYSGRTYLNTSGAGLIHQPHMQQLLPPVPIAAPQLVLYAQCGADLAGDRNQPFAVRIGFTTAPLSAAMYTEIAETWGW